VSEVIYYCILVALLLVSAVGYFRMANRFNIIDKPNERSSHRNPTIRGGGILFPIGGWVWFSAHSFDLPWFIMGLTLLAIISFLDDVNPQSATFRFLVHAFAISLLFYQVSFFDWPVWLVILAFIVSIGALNAFNFMDGINGITGMYAVVSLGTFYYIQKYVFTFVAERIILTFAAAVLVFLFFNFRKRARCFAGDVGSMSLAFVQIFLLVALIEKTENLLWVLLFLVFGIDTVITILYRLKRRENIFKPHRSHLYQHLANESTLDHRLVALFYAGAQLVINGVVIRCFINEMVWFGLFSALVFVTFYLIIHRLVFKRWT
jgi:UDP-GlcNAc:undecaprenyl-phosphate/decaprenyl-phosphate GlcNAc-1-phosphate transferase